MNQTAQKAKKLFVTNPMKMEVTRFRSRFLNPTESTSVNRTLLSLVIVSYLVILGSIWSFRTDIPPTVLILLQCVLGLIAAPTAAHAVIAGEKDRRSWDLLQSAPVSQAEIVVGKFMGVCGLVTGLMVAFLPAIVITALFYRGSGWGDLSIYRFVMSELFAATSCYAAVAFTINLSARLKNANATLVTSIASLVGALVIYPLGLAVLLDSVHGSERIADILLAWHPIYAIIRLLSPTDYLFSALNFWFGIPLALFYSGLTVFFLRRAEAALRKPKTE